MGTNAPERHQQRAANQVDGHVPLLPFLRLFAQTGDAHPFLSSHETAKPANKSQRWRRGACFDQGLGVLGSKRTRFLRARGGGEGREVQRDVRESEPSHRHLRAFPLNDIEAAVTAKSLV